MQRTTKIASLAAFALMLGGCTTTRIGRILHDPAHFQHRDVTIEGRVTGAVGAFVAGGYQVDDGSGRIVVLSSRGVPARGARVKVRGSVTPGINAMGMNYGTTLRESHHKVYY